MIELGHLERLPNPADRRSYLLARTEQGRAIHARARPLFGEARRAVELLLDTSPAAVHAAVVDLVAALDAEVAHRKAGAAEPARTAGGVDAVGTTGPRSGGND
jgi:DNA-binding MarR family transcriptional regulator